MGVVDFSSAARAQAVAAAKTVHETRGFGIREDLMAQDIQSWRALHQATQEAIAILTPDSSAATWKETAFAFATCFARTPHTLAENLDALELRDQLVEKLDQSPHNAEITAYLTGIIPQYQCAQTPEHVAAFEQMMA